MFEKLVVSTNRRQRGRTLRFFVCTSMTYLIAIASAFALSVFFAEPRLADSSEWRVVIPPSRPPEPPPPYVGPKRQESESTPRQDPRNVMRYEALVDRHRNTPPRIEMPSAVRLGEGDGVLNGDPNGPVTGAGVGIGVTGGEGRAIEPPRPPDPPRPQPRIAEDRKPVPVTSTVLLGKALDRVVPTYPELAKRIRLQGDVSVEVIISPEGRVESARVVSGHPMLVKAALDAARSWRFGTTFLNGVPVRVSGVITFVFKL